MLFLFFSYFFDFFKLFLRAESLSAGHRPVFAKVKEREHICYARNRGKHISPSRTQGKQGKPGNARSAGPGTSRDAQRTAAGPPATSETRAWGTGEWRYARNRTLDGRWAPDRPRHARTVPGETAQGPVRRCRRTGGLPVPLSRTHRGRHVTCTGKNRKCSSTLALPPRSPARGQSAPGLY